MTGAEEDLIEKSKKLSLGLLSDDRKHRKQTYIDLQQLFTDSKFTDEELLIVFNETQLYTLNGLRDKSETVREEAIKFIEILIINVLPLNDYYLTYIFPIIVERIGSVEIVETSEEIRLQLVELLDKIVEKYSNTEQLKPFLNNIVTIYNQTIQDKYPSIKEKSLEGVIKLAKALPQNFHMQAETLIPPVLNCFAYQRYKIRLSAIKCIGEIVMHSSYKALDQVLGKLAEKLFDQVPLVRRAVAQEVARWLLSYRDRYSCFHKLLPLLLTGLNDEIAETRQEAHELWSQVGLQYQKENEHDLKDQLDFLIQPPEYYLEGVERPNLGCRVLVQRNVGKLTKAISNELNSWQTDVRIRCSQLLCSLALHAESYLTQHLQDLLPAMYSTAKDEEEIVVENIKRASEIIGLFVRYKTWSQLVLPLFDNEIHYGHLIVLSGLCKGCPKKYCGDFVQEITSVLAKDEICCSRKKLYQRQLLSCCNVIMEKLEPKIDNSTTGYNLLKIIISLISLKHQDNNEEINTILIEKLAMVLNISTEELWTKYTNDLLNHVNNEPKSWTSVSDSACIFQTILTECGSCFGQNLPIIGDILTQSLDCDVDAELRLKLFCTLANCFENKSITFKGAEDLNDFFHKLIESVFVPSLVWHAGCTAETIRTMAAACLRCALLPTIDLFSCPNTLRTLFDQLLPLLLSLIEDASYRSRQLAVECIVLLKEHCRKLDVFTLEDLIKIYPELLKRLDDPTEKVRLTTLISLNRLFTDVPNEFCGATFRAHHELIIDTLMTHFDDDDDIIQNHVLDILKVFVKINQEEVLKKIEIHRPLLRNNKGCNEIVDFINFK